MLISCYILALTGQTNSVTTLDLFLPTSGGRPFFGAMVERRDGPSWLPDDDDDDDDDDDLCAACCDVSPEMASVLKPVEYLGHVQNFNTSKDYKNISKRILIIKMLYNTNELYNNCFVAVRATAGRERTPLSGSRTTVPFGMSVIAIVINSLQIRCFTISASLIILACKR